MTDNIDDSMPIRAKRGNGMLGNVPIPLYQMPNGSHVLAGRNVTDIIKVHHSTLAREYGFSSLSDLRKAHKNPGAFSEKKSLETLPDEALPLAQIRADTGEMITPIPFLLVDDFWGRMAAKGNTIAKAITTASVVEVLERRANEAFGIVETIEQVNKRFASVVEIKKFLLESGLGELAGRQAITKAYNRAEKLHPELITDEENRMYIAKLLRFLEPSDQARFTPLLVDRPWMMIKCWGGNKASLTIAGETYQEHLDRRNEELGRIVGLDEYDPESADFEDPFLLKF